MADARPPADQGQPRQSLDHRDGESVSASDAASANHEAEGIEPRNSDPQQQQPPAAPIPVATSAPNPELQQHVNSVLTSEVRSISHRRL